MNINAINEISMKKNNLKLRESNPQPTTPETSTTKPEMVMNALHIQGMNNVAFKANPAKLAKVAKDLGKKAAVALPLILGAGALTTTTTSCDPDIWNPHPVVIPMEPQTQRDSVVVNVEVNNSTTVNIDFDQSAFTAWLEKLYNQGQITQEQNAAWQAKMLELIEQYGNDAEAFQAAMLKYAAEIAISTSGTAENSKDILAVIQSINGALEKGLIKFDEALEIIKNIDKGMGIITAWMEKLYDQNKIDKEDYAKWHTEMMDLAKSHDANSKEFQLGMLDLTKQIAISTSKSAENTTEILARYEEVKALLEKGAITLDEAVKMLGNIDSKLDTIIGQLDEMAKQNEANHQEMIKEQNKANELLDKIANGQELSIKEFEELKEIVKNISGNVEVIKGNTYDLIALAKDPTRHNELIETIKNSVNDPVEFERFEELFKFYGLTIADAITMTGEELAEKLDLFMEKYAASEALNQQKLDEISAKIDKLLDSVGKLSNDLNTYYNIFDGYWTKALALLSNISSDVSGLKDLQKDANKMLNALLNKVNEFGDLLKSNEGMTVDEFKEALQERDQKQYEKWVQFTIDMGLDKLAGDVATIKDYVAAMKGKLDSMKDYSAQLDRIIDKLDGLDLTAEENQEILKAIEEAIKNHKCDCNCGDNGNHEGILGDVEDALNGLV